jgi:ketosteroid isomerase-like protein
MSSIKIIENFYLAFKNQDYDLFCEICSDNVEWIQNKGFPKGGHHHGTDAVINKVWKQFGKDWNYFKFQVEEIFESPDGSRATAIGVYLGEHKQTRKTVEAAAAHIFDIDQAKIKKFRQFTDTALVQAATVG